MAELVQRLDKPGGLEDTLSYVNLPVLSYTAVKGDKLDSKSATAIYSANDTRRRDRDTQQENQMEQTSIVAVFDKLAEVGVRSILPLQVEQDLELDNWEPLSTYSTRSPPHTDTAIERAIRGQDSLMSSNTPKRHAIHIEIWYEHETFQSRVQRCTAS